MKRIASLLLLSLLAAPALAEKAYRAGPGTQFERQSSLPETIAGRRTVWADMDNNLRFWNGTTSQIVAMLAATSKGDISVFNGSAVVALPVGTDGQCLMADSSEASGLKYGDCSSGGGSVSLTCGAGLTCSPTTITGTGSITPDLATLFTSPTLSGTVAGTYNLGGTPTATAPIRGNIAAATTSDSWTNVTYTNSYIDYGAPYASSAYYKDALARVHARVAAKSGTPAASMFTFPVKYRPAARLLIPCFVDTAITYILVNSDGTVVPGAGGATITSCSFSFTAEN